MSTSQRQRPRTTKTVAAAIVVALIQLIVTVVLIVMFVWDLIGVSSCQDCSNSAGATARIVMLVTVAFAWMFTIGGIVVGYLIDRSPAWVPAVSVVATVVAYVVAHNVIQQGLSSVS